MIIASILSSLAPILVSSPSPTAIDSIAPLDSTRKIEDSLMHPAVRKDSLWSMEYSLLGGFESVDFSQRSQFVSDLALDASTNKWTIDQPFGASDIGPRAGLEFAVKRKDKIRLATAAWYQGWSAQAIARSAAGELNHRSYGSDLLIGSVGADLLISKSILRLDAGRDAFVGGRFLLGTGRLEGRNTVWAYGMGFSMATGAEFLDWRQWAVAGQLGLDWLNLRSDSPWSDVLWSSTDSRKVAWNGGGLSLMLSLRWGSRHDSIPGQKSTRSPQASGSDPASKPQPSPVPDTSKGSAPPASTTSPGLESPKALDSKQEANPTAAGDAQKK